MQEIEVIQVSVLAGSDVQGDRQSGQNKNSVIRDATKVTEHFSQVIDRTRSWVLLLPFETSSWPALSLYTAKNVELLKKKKSISLSSNENG